MRRTVLAEADGFGGLRDVQALAGLIDRRRAELEIEVRPLGSRLFAEKTGRFVDRMRVYWNAWRAETASDPTLAPHADVAAA